MDRRIPKMNWDRVNKENLDRRHGSKLVREEKQTSAKTSGKRRANSRPVGPMMKGCTCGKPVGFVKEHKMDCPMRGASKNSKSPAMPKNALPVKLPINASTTRSLKKPMSLSEFASRIKKAGHQDVVRSLFNLELVLLRRDSSVSPRQRDETIEAIQSFLDNL
jgi:hypothetical protein